MPIQVRLKLAQAFIVVLILGFAAGCGGGAPLTVTLSPSAATLSVNASDAIDASTTPALSKHTGSITWSIQEYQSSSSGLASQRRTIPRQMCPQMRVSRSRYGLLHNSQEPTNGQWSS